MRLQDARFDVEQGEFERAVVQLWTAASDFNSAFPNDSRTRSVMKIGNKYVVLVPESQPNVKFVAIIACSNEIDARLFDIYGLVTDLLERHERIHGKISRMLPEMENGKVMWNVGKSDLQTHHQVAESIRDQCV